MSRARYGDKPVDYPGGNVRQCQRKRPSVPAGIRLPFGGDGVGQGADAPDLHAAGIAVFHIDRRFVREAGNAAADQHVDHPHADRHHPDQHLARAGSGCYVSNNWLPSLLVERAFSASQASFSAALFTSGGAVGTIVVGLLLGVATRGQMTVAVFTGCVVALFALAFANGVGLIMPAVFALGLFVTTAKNMLYGVAPLFWR